ncbi:MAG: sulfatase [Planctomycetes bacterium]|nr:sulfatase [Planctomycetota bacterium]
MRRIVAVSLCALAACSPPSGAHGVRHVVLISCDTLRADALGVYAGERDRLAEWGAPPAAARTPRIDRLAREGIVFENATTAAPTTLASHTSLFSGLWPNAHGVARNGFEVRPEIETLAERLAARGFDTAGFAGSFALDRRFGIAQGFAHWDQELDLLIDGRAHEQNERRASKVTDAVLGYLDASSASRRFLFVHYFDAHAAYDPPERAIDSVAGRAVTGSIDDLRAAVAEHQQTMGAPRGLDATIVQGLDARWLGSEPVAGELDRALVARYAGEVSYVDREVGRLLDGLAARGILKDAMVILVADHGETLLDHCDVFNHGLAVYQSTVHVPLLVRLPDGSGAGCRVATGVSNVDVLPTVVELADLAATTRVDGVSLVPALEGRAFARGPVFSSATQPPSVEGQGGAWLNFAKAQCVRDGDFKLIETPYLGRRELYDLAVDPFELRDLINSTDPRFVAAEKALSGALSAWRAGSQPLPSKFDRSQTDEAERRLKELGYAGR